MSRRVRRCAGLTFSVQVSHLALDPRANIPVVIGAENEFLAADQSHAIAFEKTIRRRRGVRAYRLPNIAKATPSDAKGLHSLCTMGAAWRN
jgi:hypothetical protein